MPDSRNAELAKIHLAKRDLGLDEEGYRAILWAICRVRSSGDLDAEGRERLLTHFQRLGWRPRRARVTSIGHPGRPHNIDDPDRGPLLRKIEALLAERKRTWSYADGVAQRMFQVQRIGWCKPDQLVKVIAALVIDARRHSEEGPGQ